ncbi:hypothetical protein HHK36_020760 [Tetracentron sinense]|uniref:C2H2-type domain-containing protein n=1 Tax=Tetracentron sinense TaxID=13715 RepID=A0A835DBX5_TETSI|nr:hypothetical protein HHK36_020760 [Tetracentron sinense]
MSNIKGDGGSFSSGNTREEEVQQLQNQFSGSNSGPSTTTNSNGSIFHQQEAPVKKKRNLAGTPDPSAEVIALSPTTLMTTNRFVCEICNKGFQRDQNLQLHRRGHNLPWKLRQRTNTEMRKRVYICPEPTCVHHNPARALGDLTGIKKHFSRKHGEKKWKCDKCSKKYAVQSDRKAHSKTCGSREYRCDCGTIFSRRDSFITHRAFCDALAGKNNKVNQGLMANMGGNLQGQVSELMSPIPINNNTNTGIGISDFNPSVAKNPLKLSHELMPIQLKPLNMAGGMFSSSFGVPRSISSSSSCLQLSANSPSSFDSLHDSKNGLQLEGLTHISATALLQKAAHIGATASSNINSPMLQKSFVTGMAAVPHLRYGGMLQHNSSYDHIQSQTHQSQLVGMDGGGFTNQFLQKGPQQKMSQFFDTAESSAMTDMGMFSALFMGGYQNHGFLKNTENEISSSTSMLQGRTANPGLGIPTTGPSRFSGNGNGDTMTVDFLGIGGSRPVNLHQQQQGLEFEAMSQQRLQGLHSLQQQFSHGQAAMEKPIWDD